MSNSQDHIHMFTRLRVCVCVWVRPWKASQLCFSQLSSSCSWCIFCLVSCTSSTFRTRWSTSCMLGEGASGAAYGVMSGVCVFYGQDDVLSILISVLKISILWQKKGSLACILKDWTAFDREVESFAWTQKSGHSLSSDLREQCLTCLKEVISGVTMWMYVNSIPIQELWLL